MAARVATCRCSTWTDALIPIVRKVDIVYGPLVDAQEFPKAVDVTLIEGAVSSQDDLEKVHTIRRWSKLVVALGDCAIDGGLFAGSPACVGAVRSAMREHVSKHAG